MTPYELNLNLDIYYESKRISDDDAVTLAYLGAYWQRVKRMPDLKGLLSRRESKEEQMTDAQMLEYIKKLNASIGGSVEMKGGEDIGSRS